MLEEDQGMKMMFGAGAPVTLTVVLRVTPPTSELEDVFKMLYRFQFIILQVDVSSFF